MPTGVIKKKLEQKGCGFISVQGGEDVFFHMSACNGQYDMLREGQTVTFDQESGPKGLKAANVVAVEDGAMAA